MVNTKKAAGAGEVEVEICSRKLRNWRCKNASADNELRYCQKHFEEMKKLPPDEERCIERNGITEGKSGSWRCKNFRLSNGTKTSSYCEKHYIYRRNQRNKVMDEENDDVAGGIQPDASNIGKKRENIETTQGSGENKLKKNKEMEKMKLPPDEHRCSQNNGSWRCKNFKMGLGEDENSVPKSRYCEKHYNFRRQTLKKKTSGDGEETTGWKPRRKREVTEEEHDRSLDHTFESEQRCCQTDGKRWRCGNLRMNHGDAAAADDVPKNKHCQKHYNLRAKYYENRKKKVMEEDVKKKVAEEDDGQRCGLTDGREWRCKNFRMGHGGAADDDTVPKRRFCEKHHNLYAKYAEIYKKKKRFRDGEGPIEDETRGSRRRRKKKVAEEDDETEIQKLRDTIDDSYTIIEIVSADIGNKKKKEMEKMMPPPDEQRCGLTGTGGRWRCKNFRMGHGPAADDDATVPKTKYCEKHYIIRAKYYENRKKRSKDGKGAAGTSYIAKTGGSEWRMDKLREEDVETEIQKQGTTIDDTSVTVVEVGTGNIRRIRKHVERGEDDGFIADEFEDFDGYVDLDNSFDDFMDMLINIPDGVLGMY